MDIVRFKIEKLGCMSIKKTNIMLNRNLMQIADQCICMKMAGKIQLKTEMAGKEQSNKIQSLQ